MQMNTNHIYLKSANIYLKSAYLINTNTLLIALKKQLANYCYHHY